MKSWPRNHRRLEYGRSSHEERGLKYDAVFTIIKASSRSSHEERGLKWRVDARLYELLGRSSHEERGLKSYIFDVKQAEKQTLLA